MTPKNERTGPDVARIAGRVMQMLDKTKPNRPLLVVFDYRQPVNVLTVEELLALAASCLTQAPEKKPRKRIRARGK